MNFKQGRSKSQSVRKIKKPYLLEVGVLKRFFLIVLISLVTLIAGCGTIAQRDGTSRTYHKSAYYYVGVQYDWRLLTLEGTGSYDPRPMLCYLSVVCPFVILASMPIDFVFDTVMLYSDHEKKIIARQEFNQYLRDEYCLAESGPNEAELKALGRDKSFCLSGSGE